MTPIDLRSDTLTKPSAAMKRAMMDAPLGDDVFGEDPTVLKLEAFVAKLLGFEEALFFPTGTMANQVALGLHLRPGDQVLGASDNHVYRWEQGGIARHWGASYKEVSSLDSKNTPGILDAVDFESCLQPDDPHYPVSRLICLENTLNFGGGLVYPQEKIKQISAFAQSHGLRMHLDGARLFNAQVASGLSLKELAHEFETVSLCLSKGLGCPLGSVLVLKEYRMREKALRLRKVFGGGMRQVGLIAAAGLYALTHNIERLGEDHRKAKRFSEALEKSSLFKLAYPVETNMVWFKVVSEAKKIQERLEQKGLKVLALTDQLLRAVFHLDISEEQVHKACNIIDAFSSHKA